MRKLIEEVGVDAPSDVVTIHDAVRLLGTPLRASELAAAVLGAQAALICEIWRMRTERQQTAALDLEGPRSRCGAQSTSGSGNTKSPSRSPAIRR